MIARALWAAFAWLVSRGPIADLLIAYAQREPYFHLEGYMRRWWVLNPYDSATRRTRYPWLKFSVRVHHILRHDYGKHLHDHPWNARTVILRGSYVERRECHLRVRSRGDTATLDHNEFHRIVDVSSGGVYTLFITGPYRGKWGFRLADGTKIAYDEYSEPRA